MNKVCKLPYISINNGLLELDQSGYQERGTVITRCSATEAGARELGKYMLDEYLADKMPAEWMYSSSVDFPEENGGPDLDFRGLIEEAFTKYAKQLGVWDDI